VVRFLFFPFFSDSSLFRSPIELQQETRVSHTPLLGESQAALFFLSAGQNHLFLNLQFACPIQMRRKECRSHPFRAPSLTAEHVGQDLLFFFVLRKCHLLFPTSPKVFLKTHLIHRANPNFPSSLFPSRPCSTRASLSGFTSLFCYCLLNYLSDASILFFDFPVAPLLSFDACLTPLPF